MPSHSKPTLTETFMAWGNMEYGQLAMKRWASGAVHDETNGRF